MAANVAEFALEASVLAVVDRESREAWPEEACGMILSDGREQFVRPVPNVQNDLHARDPEAHPRDARTAYAYDAPRRLEIEREADEKGRPVAAFYHSHPEHAAYFSKEDETMALFGDEPAYPDAVQIVVSVIDREIRDRKAFSWDPEAGAFVEIPLRV